MSSDPAKTLNPNHFYILHVEDDPKKYNFKEPVMRCLGAYGIPEDNIEWTLAKDREDAFAALAVMRERLPLGRGFDAILCDLAIPVIHEDKLNGLANREGPVTRKDSVTPDTANGLAVAQAARGYGWPTAIIGITNWSEDERVLERKREQHDGLYDATIDGPLFDEFLGKTDLTDQGGVGDAKLKRWLIPTAHFVARARKWSPPIFFGRSLWYALRGLVQIAASDEGGRRLPRILLLGEPGCGKGVLARTYYELLKLKAAGFKREDTRLPRTADRWDHLYVVNCASLVAEGEGGRVRLFGYRGPRNATLHTTPGVFEMASTYGRRTQEGFAFADTEPDYSAGGVVFLDEFVEMRLELQAAVLNTLEEGVVSRQDGSRVKIGCHVVFATNATSEQVRDRIRSDLLDRIPYVLEIPPLRKRSDEINDLIKDFADDRLRRTLGGGRTTGTFDVRITPSARQIIARAVDLNLITSIRQLQAIATVQRGETTISDGNLSWILQKARILGIPTTVLTSSEEGLTLAVKAKLLQLPSALQNNSLPPPTEQALEFLYKLHRGWREDPNKAFPRSKEGKTAKRCFYFLLIFIREAPELTGQKPDAIRAERHRLAVGLKIDTQSDAQVISYLLDPTDPETDCE
jgi:hypothetical protein